MAFNPPAGAYPGTQQVTISYPVGHIVIYTTDGTNPEDYIITDGGLALFDDGELITTGDVQ